MALTGKNLATEQNWRRRLAGEMIPIHDDGFPDYGFYRVPTRDKTSWRTVAYWYEGEDGNGKLRCLLGGDRDLTEAEAQQLWSWASKNPISHDTYSRVVRGEAWPDLNSVVSRSNLAPDDDSLEGLRDAIDDLAREAERLIKAGGAKTKDAADQASDVANKLGQLQNRADSARKVEKQPHLNAERAVDEKWRPIIAAAGIYTALKAAVIDPWFTIKKAEKDRAEAEARRIAAEAEETARQAEETARRLAEAAENSAGTEHDEAAAGAARVAQAEAARVAEAAHEAQQNVKTVAATPITAGTRGRSTHLTTKTVATITDRAAVFAFFDGQESTRELITELLQKMVNAAVKAKITVPGVSTSKDAKAA